MTFAAQRIIIHTTQQYMDRTYNDTHNTCLCVLPYREACLCYICTCMTKRAENCHFSKYTSTMSNDSDSAEFVRICNPPPLNEMCASVMKQHYISNVHRTFDKYFPREFGASEMSCLAGPYEYQVLPVMLHTLLMSSPTFLPFTKEVMGEYN